MRLYFTEGLARSLSAYLKHAVPLYICMPVRGTNRKLEERVQHETSIETSRRKETRLREGRRRGEGQEVIQVNDNQERKHVWTRQKQ